jgi:integrase
MAVYKQPKSKYWWYKFVWNGKPVRESTKQSNRRIAEQMEAARRTQFAKGEVGIRDMARIPTLAEFAEERFRPFVQATFVAKPKTKVYYENGLNNLLAFDRLADETIDEITSELIAAYVAERHNEKLEISSINRELQVLRRMFNLAYEWKVVERPLDRVRMLKGENQRDRVLTSEEEKRYLSRSAPLLRDVAVVLVDCALRPEECFRLKPVHVQHGNLEIPWGKTENSVRKIPMTPRVDAIITARERTRGDSPWLFPAPTASGHIEPSSLKKQHAKACKLAKLEPFDLYTFRHTCLTRWAPHMDVFTLQYLAGHSDIRTTRRYIHPQQQDTLKAMARARKAQRGHTSRHTANKTPKSNGGSSPRK